MRRGAVIQLAVFAAIAAAVCIVVALAIPWLPVAASRQAQRIDFVYWFTTAIAIAVFSAVMSVIAYSVWKFRARPDDDSDGPPIHGHTKLEIWWTAIPAVLVTAISVVSAIVLAQNSNAGSNPVKIGVLGRQFAWQFSYSNGQKLGYLEVPLNRKVKLDITADDVIHSFWVPQFSQKQDAVPGAHNSLVITPIKLGTFPVICTELCGLGHSLMRSYVKVVPPAEFATFLKNAGKQPPASPGLAAFDKYGCNSCHTLQAASSTGTIGPDLDKLKQYATQANRGSLNAFIKESIVDPGVYIQPGYQDQMPHTFGTQIPAGQLTQLVQYLAQNAK
ncbi:MAG TPA: cytochrome c oxidase subunit II [Gaiellaceae bacterium]|nr:cytochrome c oxidase subunit II [Gaiellaceae bacterium]